MIDPIHSPVYIMNSKGYDTPYSQSGLHNELKGYDTPYSQPGRYNELKRL